MVHLIIWVVVGLLALSFFGISLRALVDNPTNQDNVSFLMIMLQSGWSYIEAWFNNFISIFTQWGK